MSLTREQILAPRKPVTEPVPAPELGEGVTLTVRRLTAREFMALSAKVKDDADHAYAHWLVACVVGEDGKALFTEDDATALGEQDATLVERLTEAAMRLNVNPKDKAKGNSQTPTADSSTPSR